MVGVRHADRGPRLGGREGSQTQAVGEEGVQTAELALLQSLRGEQHVHTQRTADPADLDEQINEVRLGGEEFGELVDDQQQRGQRVEGGAGRAGPLVLVDVGVVARRAQQLLAAVHLALDRVTHPVDEGGLTLQVRDHGRGVRHLRHAGEGRTTLEVGEDEVEDLRGVGDRQCQHQGAQHLGLSGAGGADAHAVRAHPLQRGLLDVQPDVLAVAPDAQRHPELLAHRPCPPVPRRVEGARVTGVHHLGEVHAEQRRVHVVAAGRDPERGELAGQRLGLPGREYVRLARVRGTGGGLQQQRVRGDGDDQVAGGLVQVAGDDLDDGDPVHALGAGQDRVGRHGGAVHDHDEVRLVRAGHRVAGEALAAGQLVRQQFLQLTEAGGDEAARAGPVVVLAVLGVRQPLRPLPLVHRAGCGRDADHQVVRRVQRRQLGDHRPDVAVDGVRVAAHRDVVERPQ